MLSLENLKKALSSRSLSALLYFRLHFNTETNFYFFPGNLIIYCLFGPVEAEQMCMLTQGHSVCIVLILWLLYVVPVSTEQNKYLYKYFIEISGLKKKTELLFYYFVKILFILLHI